MSLFGARKTSTFQRAKERAEKLEREKEASSEASVTSSSHIGRLLDKVMGPVSDQSQKSVMVDSKAEFLERQYHGTQEYERLEEEEKPEMFEYGLRKARIEDDLRRREDSQATSRVESGQLPSDLDEMRTHSELTGKTGVTGITRYGTDESSDLSSPPVTNYGGSEVSFPSQTPRQSTEYEGSIVGFPPSAIPQDPFTTPRASGKSILAKRYNQSEEDTSMNAAMEEEE